MRLQLRPWAGAAPWPSPLAHSGVGAASAWRWVPPPSPLTPCAPLQALLAAHWPSPVVITSLLPPSPRPLPCRLAHVCTCVCVCSQLDQGNEGGDEGGGAQKVSWRWGWRWGWGWGCVEHGVYVGGRGGLPVGEGGPVAAAARRHTKARGSGAEGAGRGWGGGGGGVRVGRGGACWDQWAMGTAGSCTGHVAEAPPPLTSTIATGHKRTGTSPLFPGCTIRPAQPLLLHCFCPGQALPMPHALPAGPRQVWPHPGAAAGGGRAAQAADGGGRYGPPGRQQRRRRGAAGAACIPPLALRPGAVRGGVLVGGPRVCAERVLRSVPSYVAVHCSSNNRRPWPWAWPRPAAQAGLAAQARKHPPRTHATDLVCCVTWARPAGSCYSSPSLYRSPHRTCAGR